MNRTKKTSVGPWKMMTTTLPSASSHEIPAFILILKYWSVNINFTIFVDWHSNIWTNAFRLFCLKNLNLEHDTRLCSRLVETSFCLETTQTSPYYSTRNVQSLTKVDNWICWGTSIDEANWQTRLSAQSKSRVSPTRPVHVRSQPYQTLDA